MPRETLSNGLVLAVDVDGRTASWCDGYFAGDRQVVDPARAAAENHDVLVIAGAVTRCDAETALGATAALHAFRPGRTRLLDHVPDEVAAWFTERRALCVPPDLIPALDAPDEADEVDA